MIGHNHDLPGDDKPYAELPQPVKCCAVEHDKAHKPHGVDWIGLGFILYVIGFAAFHLIPQLQLGGLVP